ncbi:ketoacyl-synt-domain-containing protein [Neurospora crassa]|nr:ketoacyl-synt-domain-containing protein [Neurospora crassa]
MAPIAVTPDSSTASPSGDSWNSYFHVRNDIPIAIVGMACRMPGNVSTPAEFWELCTRARSGWSETPKQKFNSARFHHPNQGKGGTLNPVGGNFLNEAISMDPQQRLLLECTFEALENAGIPKHTIAGKDIGVFVGGPFPEYESHLFSDPDTIPMDQATGCAYAMQSNRISHFFDLRGPSFTADTACSSSMVAIHLACQSLRTGESSAALVGGCHLNMLPEFWISFSTCRLLSDAGRSFSFDNRGTGFGRGEGCGMIVLKPLDQAIKDKDPIRAVIAATGLNQDGKTRGITVPHGPAQEDLIRKVYGRAGLDPNLCGFVEAHGTGTRVGDPIEATAIHNVLGQERSPRNPLWIGSVKSKIGHLEGASGIAGVIKAALMLERGFILPNHDFKQPNPRIPWKEWNLEVPVTQRPWPRGKKYISVNNFGFGGTNGHAVLTAAPFLRSRTSGSSHDNTLMASEKSGLGRKLYVATTRDKAALSQQMKNIVVYLEQRPEIFQVDLTSNLAYTLGQRRSLLQWRAAIPAINSFELIEAINGEKAITGKEIEPLRLGFIFTGQGAQRYAMGRELYEQHPTFSASILQADACLIAFGAEWSLVEELGRDAKTSGISEAHISQPSCTAVQLALVNLLRGWGLRPTAVAGHSSGEIAAAYAAGITDFESAMAIAYHRGRLIPILKAKYPELQGRMMAVGGSKKEFKTLIEGLQAKEVRIACYNSPSSLTISGDEPALAELERICEKRQLFNRRLVVDVAYHFHHMNLVAKDYRASIANLQPPARTDVQFHSSLYGHPVDSTDLQPNYWVDNLTCPVRFSEALQSMLAPVGEHKHGVNMLVELGPHSGLQGPVKQVLKEVGGSAPKIPYASVLVRKRNAVETALELAAQLFIRGANLDLGAVNFPKTTKPPTLLTDLPRYPSNHSARYWQESRMTDVHKNAVDSRSDIIGTLASYSSDLEPTWRNIVRLDDLPWLRHHKIQSLIIYPMSAFLAMAMEAASQRAKSKHCSFDRFQMRDIAIKKPLAIPDNDIEVTISLRPHQEGIFVSSETWDEFRVCSWSSGQGWIEHCVGLIATVKITENDVVQGPQTDDGFEDHLHSVAPTIDNAQWASIYPQHMYETLNKLGVVYGPTFQGLDNINVCDTQSTGDLVAPDVAKEMPGGYLTKAVIQPAFFESLIGMYWPVLGAGRRQVDTIYLPSAIEYVTISRRITQLASEPGNTLRAICKGEVDPGIHRPFKVHMVAAPAGSLESMIAINGLTVSPVLNDGTREKNNTPRDLCYKLEWEHILEPEHVRNQLPVGAQTVIIHEDSNFQLPVALGLANALEQATGRLPEVGKLDTVDAKGKSCIFLNELHPYMVTGLSRSIRSETALRFATLDLDEASPLSEAKAAEMVICVFKMAFGSASSSMSELEFMERGGSLFTPRITHDRETDQEVQTLTNPRALEPTAFGDDGRLLRLEISALGALHTLHFVDDHSLEVPLAIDQLEIEVKAVGLSFRDAMAAKGQIPITMSGAEASGIVVAVGSSISAFKIGDRVAALTQGAFATRTRATASLAIKVPGHISFEAAATLPLGYCVAYYSLVDVGRLAEGETVLIHQAAGAVGQAAICLAQMIGAEIFATVGSAEKKELLINEFSLPSDHVLYSRHTSFGPTIRRATYGKGVDVILNSLVGDGLRESWKSLSKFGRLVDIGKRDSASKSRTEISAAKRNASFVSVDIFALLAERPRVLKRVFADVARLLRYGRVRSASPLSVFPVSDIEGALKMQQSGSPAMGKAVVALSGSGFVKAPPSRRLKDLLHSDATYILVGGTGGLGRSIARWMAGKGAQNIVLVSRSASFTGKVKELAEDLSMMGVSVHVRRCNVVNEIEVDELIRTGLQGLPPIRGIVLGTMVLHDVLFEKMTWTDYTEVIKGKVQGGWNFHRALSTSPLDFFVAISSAASAYRLTLGLPTSSLDLTAVSDSGYLAEDPEKAAEVARNLGSDTICEAEVLALLHAAISGKLTLACNDHTITGMRITSTMRPFWTDDAKFKAMRMAAEDEAARNASLNMVVSFSATLKNANSLTEAEDIVCKGLVEKISSVLMLDAEDMDITRSLSHYLLDSLVAIEIRNFITRDFEANLQVLELLSSGSIQTLAKAERL